MARKGQKHRNEMQLQKDYELIKDLRLKRWTVRQMSGHEELKHITFQQIHKDLKKIEEEWKNNTDIDLDKKKQEQLQTLDYVIRECTEAWEKSKAEKVKKSVKKKDQGSGSKQKSTQSESSIQTETIQGDHNYMKRALDAIQEQNRILGLHAPVKTDNKNHDDVVISFRES